MLTASKPQSPLAVDSAGTKTLRQNSNAADKLKPPYFNIYIFKMKSIIIWVFAICSTSTFGQAPTSIKIPDSANNSIKGLQTDTSFKVLYANHTRQIDKPAYFLNGEFVKETSLTTLNPKQIENINIIGGIIQVEGIRYNGQIQIKTKSSYILKLISLTDLKNKYTNLKNKPVVFMIDGNIITANYDNYMVDENYLLTIFVDKIENTKENIDLGLIKLLTKSDTNIKNSGVIRIRGRELAMKK